MALALCACARVCACAREEEGVWNRARTRVLHLSPARRDSHSCVASHPAQFNSHICTAVGACARACARLSLSPSSCLCLHEYVSAVHLRRRMRLLHVRGRALARRASVTFERAHARRCASWEGGRTFAFFCFSSSSSIFARVGFA